MQTLNFNQETTFQPQNSDCYEEGYDAYFSGEPCLYSNDQDEKLMWDIGYQNAKMDDK